MAGDALRFLRARSIRGVGGRLAGWAGGAGLKRYRWRAAGPGRRDGGTWSFLGSARGGFWEVICLETDLVFMVLRRGWRRMK